MMREIPTLCIIFSYFRGPGLRGSSPRAPSVPAVQTPEPAPKPAVQPGKVSFYPTSLLLSFPFNTGAGPLEYILIVYVIHPMNQKQNNKVLHSPNADVFISIVTLFFE